MSDVLKINSPDESDDWPSTTIDAKKAEFTPSGSAHFSETVGDYSDELFRRAKVHAEAVRAPGFRLEITHEHVRAAARSIANSYGAPKAPWWSVPGQIGELLAMAVVGWGTNNLNRADGIIAFGVGLSIAAVLLALRLAKGKGG